MKKKSGFLKAYIYASLCLVIGIGVDQFTKYLAVKHLKNQESFVIIKGVFYSFLCKFDLFELSGFQFLYRKSDIMRNRLPFHFAE